MTSNALEFATGRTPGPWETDGIAVRSSGPNGRQIALCEITVRGRPYEETYDEARANARLIAAAPDLSEALVYACDRLQRFLDTFGEVGDYVTQADIYDWQALTTHGTNNAQPGDTPSADGTKALYEPSLPQIPSIDARVKELETALARIRNLAGWCTLSYAREIARSALSQGSPEQ